MSTLFRLIEAREYSDRNNELYVQDIEKYFAPVKNDSFLSTLKNIRNEKRYRLRCCNVDGGTPENKKIKN